MTCSGFRSWNFTRGSPESMIHKQLLYQQTMRRTNLLVLTAAVIGLTCSACDTASPSSESWECTVTLTLEPSRLGNLSSPSGSGTGTGTGSTREEALNSAYERACSQLPLSDTEARLCRSGEDFNVEGDNEGNIRLFSAVSRSVRCSNN